MGITFGSSVTLTGTAIENNDALGSPTCGGGTSGQGIGGGVYNLGTFTYDSTSVIKKNHASTSNNDIFSS